jgi:hypothetical protein
MAEADSSGYCPSGKSVVSITADADAGGRLEHLRCADDLQELSPTMSSFIMCWNYACMPAEFENKTLDIDILELNIPGEEI